MDSQTRLAYTFEKVGRMLRWLATSGVITFFLIQLTDWIGGLKLSPELATGILVLVNTLLFAIRSYVDGEDK